MQNLIIWFNPQNSIENATFIVRKGTENGLDYSKKNINCSEEHY